jgi:hypothetical protein
MEVVYQLHATSVLPPVEQSPVPIGLGDGWDNSHFARYGEETNFVPTGIRTPVLKTVQNRRPKQT